MLPWLEQFLVRYPELALFLVIAAGYWIGSFRIGAFSLGPVMGALFAGLAVGDFAHVPVSGLATAIVVARALQLDPGFAAGLMAGGLSQSAAMGTATDAINGLAIDEQQ